MHLFEYPDFKQRLKETGLTQKRFSQHWGISLRTVQRWANQQETPLLANLLLDKYLEGLNDEYSDS